MPVIPNRGKQIYIEKNVDIPGMLRPASVYDLALFLELGRTDRAVLVVTPICRINFVNGSGSSLNWSAKEKTDFMQDLRDAWTAVWSEKHVLKTVTKTALTYDTISVLFDIQVSDSLGSTSHSHWDVKITKIASGSFKISTTANPYPLGILNGSVELDSEDLIALNKGSTQKQRGAVHEFGHMMGFKDEYVNKSGTPVGVAAWTTDLISIMNLGETVRPRHYIFLAHWCNEQHMYLGQLSKQPIEWKVNGSVNMATAMV